MYLCITPCISILQALDVASFRCCEGIYKLVTCDEQNLQRLVYNEQKIHFAKI
jgi:hypothetical protein